MSMTDGQAPATSIWLICGERLDRPTFHELLEAMIEEDRAIREHVSFFAGLAVAGGAGPG